MNFKIENNFLDITNYPSIEKHFEKRASQGWLITNIVIGSLFIYKKIKAEKLDFSISPYEVETAYTRKTKAEIEEFQSVCESVGWNYCLGAGDLHIYYKEAGTEAVDISTDDEEEFNTLERIGKKQVLSSYISIPFYLYLSWNILGGLFSDVQSLKNGMVQIIAPIIPIFFISAIYRIIRIKKFLKTNRKNIDMGRPLQYLDSKFIFERISFFIYLIFMVLFIGYSIYSAFVLKNKFILLAFMPIFIGVPIGLYYRIFIKPSKKTIKYKKVFLIVFFIITTLVSINITFLSINSLAMQRDNPDIEGYKVLSANDFLENKVENDGDLMMDSSLLIPTSYTYWSWPEGDISVKTEYADTLTEEVGKILVKRYIKEAEKSIANRISWEIEILIEEDIYDYSLETSGISKESFDSLKGKELKEAEKEAIEIARENSISKDKANLWNLDEVYFLNYQKDEIVIRNGKEVFYLTGRDFSDPEIINIVKDKLGL